MRVVQHPFHLDTLSGVDASENIARKKKVSLVAVKGCMLAAFMCDVFDVCFMEETPELGGGGEALDVLKDQFCLLVTEFKINPICIFHILKASYMDVRII